MQLPDPITHEAVLEHIWQHLAVATKKRKSAFHTLTVGSVDAQGIPDQRTMVLRAVYRDDGILRFHTDARSPKTLNFSGNNSPISIIGYDAPAKIQLRMRGTGWIETDSERAEAAWENSSLFARRCYVVEPAPGDMLKTPGSGLPEELAGVQPVEEQVIPGRPNFALLMARIDYMDWLYLAHTGHRRTQFTKQDDGTWQGQWVVP